MSGYAITKQKRVSIDITETPPIVAFFGDFLGEYKKVTPHAVEQCRYFAHTFGLHGMR